MAVTVADTMQGNSGDDIMDGDAWDCVRIEYIDANGHEQSVDSLKDIQADLLAGVIDPASMRIVREILKDPVLERDRQPSFLDDLNGATGPQDVDRDEFIELSDRNPQDQAVDDGADDLRNIEFIRFDTGSIAVNNPPTGTLRMNRLNSLAAGVVIVNLLADPDGIAAGSFQMLWDELIGATWIEIAGATGSTLTEAQRLGNENSIIRGGATWTDGASFVERVSAPQLAVTDTNLDNDVLNGTAVAEHQFGFGGNDTLNGDGGHDALPGGEGADTYDAGAGDDTIYADQNDLSIDGGTGLDQVILQATGNATVPLTLDNVEVVFGSQFDDYIVVGSATQGVTMHGGDGNDSLVGGGFGDTLYGEAGNDMLLGGAGTDTLDGGAGTDMLVGGTGDDLYVIDANDTIVEAVGGGDDTVHASNDYVMHANVENVVANSTVEQNLTGNASNNTLLGNNATNLLQGGGGDDILHGMGGDDHLHGNAGADVLLGGSGDDVYFITDLLDQILEINNEGSDSGGIDRVYTSVDLTLAENVENGAVLGGAGVRINGNALDNSLTGNSGNDVLYGGAGNDVAFGGDGIDIYELDGYEALRELLQIARESGGWVQVNDTSGQGNGFDSLFGIERIRFRGDGFEFDL